MKGPHNVENTAIFSASFCNGAVECVVLTDQGSDTIIWPHRFFNTIIDAKENVKMRVLNPPYVVQGVGNDSKIT